MLDVNIKGVLYGIAAALPYMKQQKSGHMMFVSSVAGPKVRSRLRRLCGDQACGACAGRRAATGSEAVQHANDGDFARFSRHRASEQHQ